MSERIANDEFAAVLEETFGRGQELIFTPTGVSMLPMLDGREDKVTFSPKPERVKKYDVLFYRRPTTGQLVLHRLVGFDKSGGYIFSGDGQYYYEYGVTYDDILAIMSAFTHKGRHFSVDDPTYRAYIRFMMIRKRLRIVASKVYRGFKKK